jgi:thiol-disulfide isomerase/thioredoxin
MQSTEFRDAPGATRHQGRAATRRQVLTGGLAAAAAFGWPGGARAEAVVRPWPAAKPTPPLDLTDLDGKAWTLAALKGRPVVLNFWASWCEPCRAEMPSLELLATRHEKAGLQVLSVNVREPLPTIRRFLELLPFSLPILLDRDGDAASAWTPRVYPTTVLIDRGVVARSSVIGELDWMGAAAAALVEPLLRTPSRSA